MRAGIALSWALGAARLAAQTPSAPAPRHGPASVYFAFAATAGFDDVALIRFGPGGASVQHHTTVAITGVAAGLRSVRVAPDGRTYYLTSARGFPSGELLKVAIAADSSATHERAPPDTVKAQEPLGVMPSAIAVTADGRTAWVTNRGDATAGSRGSVSIVYLNRMAELARIATCGDAAGSALSPDDSRHYSVCGRDDALVEIDAHHLTPTRWFSVAVGHEHGDSAGAAWPPAADSSGPSCDPDWVTVAPDSARLYVACRRSGDVVEVDAVRWTMLRRIALGTAVLQCAVTHDGRTLVVADSVDQSVALVDLASGRVAARIMMPRVMPEMAVVPAHARDPMMALLFGRMALPRAPVGLVITPDDRYAMVAVTGVAGEPGSVQIVDLQSHAIVADVAIAPRATAIDFWKMTPVHGP